MSIPPVTLLQATSPQPYPHSQRGLFLLVAGIGTAWNLFGLSRYFATLAATPESLASSGMTPDQIVVYLSLPAWVNAAFALGTVAGFLGSVALALRRRWAQPVLALSFASYVALIYGDARHGLFDVLPQQLPILVVVLLVALFMLGAAVFGRRTGWLT